MIPDNFLIHSFEPLFLTIDRIGPFQESPSVFDFTNEADEPCNFYLFVSENGRGKTTILELMAVLMNMLGHREMESLGHDDLDRHKGSVQWDILLKLFREGQEQTVVLSLIAGTSDSSGISVWTEARLAKAGATSWHRFGFRRRVSGRFERIGKNDDLVNDLLSHIKIDSETEPLGFEDSQITSPTLLFFSAYRDIPSVSKEQRSIVQPDDWGYRPVYTFSQDGTIWTKSLDNLMVWLRWLDDGRFERAREIINDRVFKRKTKFLKGVRKSPPEAIIMNEGQQHSLDKLSSGEKSLVQLFLRIGTHMTRNTILLIDEMDVHLHPKMQHRLLNILKDMVKDTPGLILISTTHSRELLNGFSFETEEKKLRKGGHIIEDDLEVV